MNLNSHIIKLSGSAEISEPLELGKRYAVGVEVGITDERKIDNENQTFDLEFKAKLIRAEIKTSTGTIKTKDNTHESRKTRYAIIASKNNYPEYSEMEEESWYKLVQGNIRHYLPEIIEMIWKSAKQ
jgi:hypothetical protein